MKRFGLLLLILSGIGLSCAPANGPLPSQQVILPLAVGNEWIGRVNEYDRQNKLDSTWLDTLRVLKSQVEAGEQWYYVNRFWIYGADTDHAWFTNRPDGLYTCDSDHFTAAYRCAKYPAKPGDVCVSFENSFDSNGYGQSRGIEVDTTNFLVNVPAGVFHCYVYSGYDISQSGDQIISVAEPEQYYAAGIGFVQFGYFNADGSHLDLDGTDRTWQVVRAELQ